ncbi:MAG: M28 family peptidase [Planctomycetes bacterium]|nr:M28 family peptidase [Planctomycetota bacterium]MCC7398437.1 M28 family peptidase [Planctomycetota bacterium]
MSERPAPRRLLPGTSVLFTALTLLTACGGSKGPIDADRAMAHVEKMVAIGPRPFGSAALAKTADYIEAEVKALGLQLLRQESVEERSKQTIRNLYVKFDGPDPQGPILMIGAHYDTKLAEGLTGEDAKHNKRFVGAIDGGGAPAVLIELARVLKDHKDLKCNVWLYWIDAEESIAWNWDHQHELVGSKAFCKWLSAEKILPRVKAFVLLDLIGSKNYKIDRDGNSDKRLQELFVPAAKALGEEDRLYRFPTERELAYYREQKINWGTTDDHNTFANFGVPSVLLIDFAGRVPESQKIEGYEQWWHTELDDLPAMDKQSLAFAGNLVMQALPDLQAFCLGRK